MDEKTDIDATVKTLWEKVARLEGELRGLHSRVFDLERRADQRLPYLGELPDPFGGEVAA